MKARDHVAAQTGKPTSRLGKADVFSVAGHDHWVDAPISAGVVNDSDRPYVGFSVDASKMVVKPDPKVDAKTQAENSEG
jgi:hypothetical protein